jgi:glutamate carboxypeptidase
MNSMWSPYSLEMHPNLAAATEALNHMVAQIGELVSLESPSRDAERARTSAHAVAALISRVAGLETSLVESVNGPHVVAHSSGTPRVLLLGHHDTVHAAGTVGTRPFLHEDGVLRGPGVFDMKAGIVQAITAVAILRQQGVDTSGISMLFTSDEEVGSQTSRGLIEQMAGPLGESGAVLVLEPSADGGALKIARKGTGTFQVVIEGRASHAGLEPEKGVNALLELAHQVQHIATFGRPELGTTVTPTVATAGTTDNTVPDRATIAVDARVVTPDEKERVESLMYSLQPVLSEAKITVTGSLHRPPMHESMSQRLFAIAREVGRDIDDRELVGVKVGGGSDGNFTAAMGIPTLDGLGAVGGGAHGPTEHVVVEEIPFRVALLAGVMRRVIEN